MTTRRSMTDLVAQTANSNVNALALKVRKRRGHIVAIEFPPHRFKVMMDGYGVVTVKADPSINFGTFARPLVSKGNDVICEWDETTQSWFTKTYDPTLRCVPDQTVNPPFTALGTYTPPLDTLTLTQPFNVDTNFPPLNIAMGQVLPTAKVPPVIGMSYDFSDGIVGTIASGSTTPLLCGVAMRNFTISAIGLSSPDATGISYTFNVNGAALITVTRTAGTWVVNAISVSTTNTFIYVFPTPLAVAEGSDLESALVASASLTKFKLGFRP